jgi:SAM-dependent methyltransferase
MGKSEIERLEGTYGWVDWKQDKNGVRRSPLETERQVSFPEDFWNDPSFNVEGMGSWAETRLLEIQRDLAANGNPALWEVGAGSGAVSVPLAITGHDVVAVEPLYGGAKYIASFSVPSFCGTLEDLSLPEGSVPAIGMFDVLEHIEKTLPILSEAKRVLAPNGCLFITVPAHKFLFSRLDEEVGHFRRYSRQELKEELLNAEFEIVSIRYLFSFLVPMAWLLRVFPEKLGLPLRTKSILNDAKKQFKLSLLLNPIFKFINRVERLIKMPFGLSLIAVARKAPITA